MHQAGLRTRMRFAIIELFRRSNHRLQPLAIERPGPDLPAFTQEVDAMRGRPTATAKYQLQKRLRQSRMIDRELLIKDIIAELRQRLPIPVSDFKLQQPHAAFIAINSFPPVNEARPRKAARSRQR
jgi:hypothetical protein